MSFFTILHFFDVKKCHLPGDFGGPQTTLWPKPSTAFGDFKKKVKQIIMIIRTYQKFDTKSIFFEKVFQANSLFWHIELAK